MKIIYYLGKKIKLIRSIYYKTTGKWLWGILGYIKHYHVKKHSKSVGSTDIEDYIHEIFKDWR